MKKSLSELVFIHNGIDYKMNPRGEKNIPIYGTGGIMGYTSIALNEGPAVLSGRKGSINRPFYVEGKFWNVDTIFCLKPVADTNAKWLYYSLLNTDMTKLNEATGVPSVTSKSLYKLQINYFELEKQKQIAEILTTCDTVIDQTLSAIEKYKAIKQGMLYDLFTRGLDASGQLRPTPQQAPELYKASELGMIPKEWEVKRLEEICDVRDGTHDSPKYFETGYPFLTSKNLTKNGRLSWEDISYICEGDYNNINKRSKVDVGDLLFGMIGTIGNPVIVDIEGFAIKNVALIKGNGKLNNRYLIQYLNCPTVERLFSSLNTGSTQKFIALGVIRDLKTLLPNEIEQDKIIKSLEQIENKIFNEETLLSKYKSIKKGLMNDLLSGKK